MNSIPILATTVVLTASLVLPSPATAGLHAEAVVGYLPGVGATPGYDQADAALYEPSRVTPGEFGGPVDPFSAPWQPTQLLSLGAGGSLTVRFPEPILNDPSNPFGLDFLVFGNSGFVITNGDFSGGGITDGSLYGNTAGTSRISVSLDGTTFFTLAPTLAPTVDSYFPTDGAGNFSVPVNPSLREADFAGLTLDGIRTRYAGSGGGTGFDIDWARDDEGRPVALDRVQFVRVDVLSDKIDIDGFSAVPEPGPGLLALLGALLLSGCRRDLVRHSRRPLS